jgi:hypothetical protein
MGRVHSERSSRHSNAVEGEIIREVIAAAPAEQRADSTAVITPHRAQRALLRTTLSEHGLDVDLFDTVERLQGGEKPAIVIICPEFKIPHQEVTQDSMDRLCTRLSSVVREFAQPLMIGRGLQNLGVDFVAAGRGRVFF